MDEVRELSPGMAIAGIEVTSLLAASLMEHEEPPVSRTAAARRAWFDLTASLASMTRPLEVLLIYAAVPSTDVRQDAMHVALVAVGRGPDAIEEARRGARSLVALVSSAWTGVEVGPLRPGPLDRVAAALVGPVVHEIRRRTHEVELGHGRIVRRPLGLVPGERPTEPPDAPTVVLQQPWNPADDDFERLLLALDASPHPTALVVHAAGVRDVPVAAQQEARARLAALDAALRGEVPEGSTRTILHAAVDRWMVSASRRVLAATANMVAARVFVTSAGAVDASVLATVGTSFDEWRTDSTDPLVETWSGFDEVPSEAAEVLTPLDPASLDVLYTPLEATAMLRPPSPPQRALPGLVVCRTRTAPFAGRPGDGASLGTCVHRGVRMEARLDHLDRFRHLYVVGQTGTGKSTLLSNLVRQDLSGDDAVVVLDPHGGLVEAVLAHLPHHRRHRVAVLDLGDHEHPVPFNPLVIEEDDPETYRRQRDLVVDGILRYIQAQWPRDFVGPMFLTAFRGMLTLMLGAERPQVEPNLELLRNMFLDARLRQRCLHGVDPEDLFLRDVVHEMTQTTGESSFANLTPYVTAKLAPFIADVGLRRITGQPRTLPIPKLIEDGTVILVNLARGRVGDDAAGLVASQVVRSIQRAVMARGAGVGRPVRVIADEFQLYADPTWAELLSEGRKFGLSLTLAHQFVSQLDEAVRDAVFGNVGTMAAFRLSPHDVEVVSPWFAPTFGPGDLATLPNHRLLVRTTGTLGLSPFSVQTHPLPEGEPESAAAAREVSRRFFATTADEAKLALAMVRAHWLHGGVRVHPKGPPEPPA